jgi:hypothetical protein
MKTVALASLYEPLEFLESKIANFNQSNHSDVLVYMSDCSSEKTWKEVDKLVRSKSKFEYVLDHHQKRETLYWTWNWIIDKTIGSKPQYYCTTNVDDVVHPDYFAKMSSFLDSNPTIQIVGCSWLLTTIPGEIWPPASSNSQILTQELAIRTLGHFPMWRASLHPSIGLFDPRMFIIGDDDFWLRIKARFGTNAIGTISKEYLGCYLQHTNNLFHTAKAPNGMSAEGWDRMVMANRKEFPYFPKPA